MKGAFFAFFIFSSVCFLFIITITSCNTIKQSSYAKDNVIKTQFFVHYFNNKAKLSIRFFGGHRAINPLVYAGYSHINKLKFSESEPSSMAKYFYQFSHVNPYSINQTTYCDIFSSKVAFHSFSNRENYYYLRNDQINDSVLLKQSELYI